MRYDTPPPSSVAMLEKSCQNLIRRVYDSMVMRLHSSYCMEVTVHSNCHSVRTDTRLNRYLRIPSVLFASIAGLFCDLGFATSSTNPSPLALWLRNGLSILDLDICLHIVNECAKQKGLTVCQPLSYVVIDLRQL